MQKPARVLMYSQDSYGLGHLRRSTTLANALVSQRPDLSVLLVVDSPVAPFFDLQDRIDFVKLPTVVKVGAGVFRPGRLLTSYRLIRAMRSTVIREVLSKFRPDLVLVDHMPGGANRDLVPALRLIRSLEYPTKVVLGLRDIIDNPAVTCAMWQREGFYDTLRRFYDAVLVYGSAEVFPTATMYEVDGIVPDAVRYCGYVCNMDPVKDPRHVRDKFDLGDEPIVVVTAGGGADAFNLMRTYLDALPLVNASTRMTTVMVTGPFMPETERRALRDQAKQLGVQVRSSVGDSLSQINAASLVVSMAGYNTISEILRFRKPAVIVPRAGPSAEQRMRATLLAKRGLVSVVEPQDLSPGRLAEALEAALRGPDSTPSGLMPSLRGIESVTDNLFSLLSNGSAARRSWPAKQQAAAKRGVAIHPPTA